MSAEAKVTLLEGFTKIFREFLQELHQSEIILDYAFSIKTESFNNSQDCVSLLVTALEELQNGIKDIILKSKTYQCKEEHSWSKEDITSPMHEVPQEILNDPFHEETVPPPFGENFESDEGQQQLAASLLIEWDEKQPCDESVIIIKSLQDEKTAADLDVLESILEDEKSEKSWGQDEKLSQQLLIDDDHYECSNCFETFTSPMLLEIHRAKHHIIPSSCDICGNSFSSLSALQTHCKDDHNGTGCFSCPLCKKRFMLRLSYERHLKSHNPSLTAVCEICGKAFKRADYLKRHYMMHSEKRPYSCDICKKTFSTPSVLKIHKLQVHERSRDFTCELCGRKFARIDKLKDHMKRHQNIRNHTCQFCNRKYHEKRDLRNHLTKCGPNKVKAKVMMRKQTF